MNPSPCIVYRRLLVVLACTYGALVLLLSTLSFISQRHLLTGSAEQPPRNTSVLLRELIDTETAAGAMRQEPDALQKTQQVLQRLTGMPEIHLAGIALIRPGLPREVLMGPRAVDRSLHPQPIPELELAPTLSELPANPVVVRLGGTGFMLAVRSSPPTGEGMIVYYTGSLYGPARTRINGYLMLEVVSALFLLVILLLIVLTGRGAAGDAVNSICSANSELRQEVDKLRHQEQELRGLIDDNDRFNAATIDREERIIELKLEVNSLLEKMHREKRYNVNRLD